MDYRQLFTYVHKRPKAYGLDGSYGQAVAFITGCDAGNSWGLLIGFREWLAMKAGSSASVAWPWLVRQVVLGREAGQGAVNAEAEDRSPGLVDGLFRLLDEFLEERSGTDGAERIIREYAQWAESFEANQ